MKNPSKRITWKEISRQKFLMVCAAIFFVYGIVFYYVPLAGWVMAFQNYKPKDGLFGSKFVGLEKFKFLFSDDVFLRDIRNTLAMGVLNLVTTFLMAIIFAILLDEVRNMFGKKLVQTISYLPTSFPGSLSPVFCTMRCLPPVSSMSCWRTWAFWIRPSTSSPIRVIFGQSLHLPMFGRKPAGMPLSTWPPLPPSIPACMRQPLWMVPAGGAKSGTSRFLASSPPL